MSGDAKAFTGLTGAWGANLALICALNPHELRHCLSLLLLYAAVYFLFLAPLHALFAAGAWAAHRARHALSAAGAVERLFAAESAVFWLLYWAMMLELVPLNLRV